MRLIPDNDDHNGDGRTGAFSTYSEVHAFIIGIAGGAILTCMDSWLDAKYEKQVQQELPYAIVGGVVGSLLYSYLR